MPGLGFTQDDFLQAYAANRNDANQLTLEASTIAKHIQAVSDLGPWKGTASALLDILNATATDDERRRRGWPKSPKTLSDNLRRIAVNL